MKCVGATPAVEGETGNGGCVRLFPVTSGSPENNEFYKATPGGNLTLATINEAAFVQFTVDKEYYVDISGSDSGLQLCDVRFTVDKNTTSTSPPLNAE